MNDVPSGGRNTTTNDNGSVRMETHELNVLGLVTKMAAGNLFTGNFVKTDFNAQTAELSLDVLLQIGLKRCLSDTDTTKN